MNDVPFGDPSTSDPDGRGDSSASQPEHQRTETQDGPADSRPPPDSGDHPDLREVPDSELDDRWVKAEDGHGPYLISGTNRIVMARERPIPPEGDYTKVEVRFDDGDFYLVKRSDSDTGDELVPLDRHAPGDDLANHLNDIHAQEDLAGKPALIEYSYENEPLVALPSQDMKPEDVNTTSLLPDLHSLFENKINPLRIVEETGRPLYTRDNTQPELNPAQCTEFRPVPDRQHKGTT